MPTVSVGQGSGGSTTPTTTVTTVRAPTTLGADSVASTANKTDIKSNAIYRTFSLLSDRQTLTDTLPRADRILDESAGSRVRLNVNRPFTLAAVLAVDSSSDLVPLSLDRPIAPNGPSIPQLSANDPLPSVVEAWGSVAAGTGQLRQEIQTDAIHAAAWTVSASGVLVSAGYIALSGRLSLWLLSLLTARPLIWKGFDPVEVLFAWEEEKRRRPQARVLTLKTKRRCNPS